MRINSKAGCGFSQTNMVVDTVRTLEPVVSSAPPIPPVCVPFFGRTCHSSSSWATTTPRPPRLLPMLHTAMLTRLAALTHAVLRPTVACISVKIWCSSNLNARILSLTLVRRPSIEPSQTPLPKLHDCDRFFRSCVVRCPRPPLYSANQPDSTSTHQAYQDRSSLCAWQSGFGTDSCSRMSILSLSSPTCSPRDYRHHSSLTFMPASTFVMPMLRLRVHVSEYMLVLCSSRHAPCVSFILSISPGIVDIVT